MRAAVLALVLLVAGVASAQPEYPATLQPGVPAIGDLSKNAATGDCTGKPNCLPIYDAYNDGKICDEVQAAANTLLDPTQPGGLPADVYLAMVPSKTQFECDRRVRICKSEQKTAADAEPTCDSANHDGFPTIHGIGNWNSVRVTPAPNAGEAPYPWLPNDSGPDAMLWIGDLWNDEAGYVAVDFPPIWWDSVYSDWASNGQWNRVPALICDGCTGRIGWKDRTPDNSDGDTSVAGATTFVGVALEVTLDVNPDSTETLTAEESVYLLGDEITLRGQMHDSLLTFGRHSNGGTGYWGVVQPGITYGDTDAIRFRGQYVVDSSFYATAVTLTASDAETTDLAGKFREPHNSIKPVVNWQTSVGMPGVVANLQALDVFSSSTTNPALRYQEMTGNVPDRSRPPVFNMIGGTYYNTAAADLGAAFSCGAGAYPPNAGCVFNVIGARRFGKQQIAGGGATGKWTYPLPGVIRKPDTKRNQLVVSGSAADGKCILNPLGAPSIATCDTTANLYVPTASLLGELRTTLLANAAAASTCQVVLEQETHPGSGVFLQGTVGAVDCLAANSPHPSCTGAGTGGPFKAAGYTWVEPHIGETASPVYGIRTTVAGDTSFVPTQIYLNPAMAYRWSFKTVRYCAGGSNVNKECLADSNCPSSTCAAAANACGTVNATELSWTVTPADREPQCYDGIDNDGDSKVDFGTSLELDPQCADRLDDSE